MLQWVEFLCFDINVHVPHHVMSKIPWYNLRAATDSLRQVSCLRVRARLPAAILLWPHPLAPNQEIC